MRLKQRRVSSSRDAIVFEKFGQFINRLPKRSFSHFQWWLDKIIKLLLFKLFCVAIVILCSAAVPGRYLKPGQLPHHVMFVKPFNQEFPYRAFCGGSIITIKRVISSASCFVTPKKRLKHDLSSLRAVAGLAQTTTEGPSGNEEIEQWRSILKIHSQKFFRSPIYDLAILVVSKDWKVDQYVNPIPYASMDQEFDGVCSAASLNPLNSWSTTKLIKIQKLHIIVTKLCKKIYMYSTEQFYCTLNREHSSVFNSMAGSGLVCHKTGDPNEVSETQGVLVGVCSFLGSELPALYTRIGLFTEWVTDGCSKFHDKIVILIVMSYLMTTFL